MAIIGMMITPGHAKVGVTSATDGDPLGRPPTAAERVLRVGIDIQANEVITTKQDDRAHILFLDGTSLTVAPNAQLVIDKYVYDPNTKTGDLALSVSKGVLRLVGGKISKTTPMVVNTPAATIGIRGGIGVIVAEPHQTQANFLFGSFMTVTARGHTEKATRAGSQITTRLGAIPGAAVIIPPGGLTNQLAILEGRTPNSDGRPDEAAKASGFSSANSGQIQIQTGQRQTGAPPAVNNVATQALSTASTDRQSVPGTLLLVNPTAVAPQIAGGGPLVTPTGPAVVTTLPQTGPTTTTPQVTIATPALSGGFVPAIQRPGSTTITGVGSGSLAIASSPATTTPSQTGPGTTPMTGGGTTPLTGVGGTLTNGGGTIAPTGGGTIAPTGGGTIAPTGGGTTGTTVGATTGPTTTPTTTPTSTTGRNPNAATPAVGVGNGGLIHAVPSTNSRGGKK